MVYPSIPKSVTAQQLVEILEDHLKSMQKLNGWDYRQHALELFYETHKALKENHPELFVPNFPEYLYICQKYRDQSQSYGMELDGLGKNHPVEYRKRLCDIYQILLRAVFGYRS